MTESFKEKIQGLVRSSKAGPEMIGEALARPLVENFDVTVSDMKEMREFLSPFTFERIFARAYNKLGTIKQAEVANKLYQEFDAFKETKYGRPIKDGSK